MRNKELRASLIKHAKTVSATVTACVTILLVLQPWRPVSDRRSEEAQYTASLSSAVDENAPVTAEPAPARIVPDPVDATEAPPAGDATDGSPDTGGEIRLAARSPSPASVPLPEKLEEPEQLEDEGLIPLPQKRQAGSIAVPQPEQVAGSLANKALAPLFAYKAPKSDVEKLKSFVKLTYQRKFSNARPLMEDMSDPIARKFARWYYYRTKAPDTTPEEIIAFLEENPRWPSRDLLQESAEDALFWREQDPKRVIAYFADQQPASGVGFAALGTALIETGEKDKGTEHIRKAWRKYPLTQAIEKKIRKLRVLNADDHRARADYLLMQDNKRYVSAVNRVLPQIDKKWKASIKARIATVKRAKNAGTLLTRLDPKIKLEPPVLFARIQWLRRADNDKKVWSLLRSAPKSAEKLVDPAAWWKERQIQVRLALNSGKVKTAYAIASGHGDGLPHWDLSDAEFLAGWIALRFLDRPKDAGKHFTAAVAAGGLPKRRSRAAYWLGRTELDLDDVTAATARFAEAAQHHHTFYGQLAHQMIASTDAKVAFRALVRPTEREIENFAANDVMKAIVLTQQADFENLMSVFLYDLARDIESAPEMTLLCELASQIAPTNRAVRMAKIAINRDFPVEQYAYPNALPDFKTLAEGEEIDNALIHALTRQESEFNTSIVSSAGAVGLMQLLPSTAKMVAKWHGETYSKKNLSADPAYNVSLGTAFLHRLISNYDGSYMMALAGYNAGPGRIRQWVRKFGDPREVSVDPIDWIERIPFTETRDYVHKIMESAQVYRSRLRGDHAPLQLAEDLHRGRKDKPKFLHGVASN
jgi:soluble lytic murein transglycosylase